MNPTSVMGCTKRSC
ncbi:MAG: hypothetical protein ACLRXQ_13965 [Phascolarctobacterium faecium]